LNKEEIQFGMMITIIALVFSMGVASLIYSNNIRMQVDFFEISYNMTELDDNAKKIVNKYDEGAKNEAYLGTGMLLIGVIMLIGTYKQFRNKDST